MCLRVREEELFERSEPKVLWYERTKRRTEELKTKSQDKRYGVLRQEVRSLE